MAKIKKRRIALSRGGFVRVQSWNDLARTHVVFRDTRGEYVRLATGVMYSNHRALTGRTGCVMDVVGGGAYRVIRMDNGDTVTVPAEILVHHNLTPESDKTTCKAARKNIVRFNRYKSHMESNGFRRGSGAAMVFI